MHCIKRTVEDILSALSPVLCVVFGVKSLEQEYVENKRGKENGLR